MQVKKGNISQAKLVQDEHEKKLIKKKEDEEAALIASLFKTVDAAKQKGGVFEEVDQGPKICEYFKMGMCQKGRKCKLSHDISTKNVNIDIYTDQRQQLEPVEEEEDMTNWDEEKLKSVIDKQQNKYKSQVQTDIVCKYFIQAIERERYGWKWVCPNGMNCHYRHCLPPGFILKKNAPKDNKDKGVAIEQLIDQQREELGEGIKAKGQLVTKELFFSWKERKKKEKEEQIQQDYEKKQKQNKGKGKHFGLSGRALFQVDQELFKDDDDAMDDQIYKERAESSDEEEIKNNEDPQEEEKTQVD